MRPHRRSPLRLPGCAIAWMVAFGALQSVEAQQYTGVFAVSNQAGGTTTVELQEDGAGRVTGWLSGNGVEYGLEGHIQEGTLTGLMEGSAGLLYFAAERREDELWLELYPPDQYGQPDYDDFTEIDLTLMAPQDDYAMPADPRAFESGDPARERVAAGRAAAGAGSGGAFGEPPHGGPGQTRSGRPLAPGFTEDHPLVLEWITYLGGNKLTTMSRYSSGSAGGYSARTDVYLCSDRTYLFRDESSVSVDVGGAFGNSGGVGANQGHWYVITDGRVVGLILESDTGELREYRMDYQGQATYANGERVYVTPAEVCG